MKLNEFLAKYNSRAQHKVIEVDVVPQGQYVDGQESPFILVKYGRFTALISPMGLPDHLDLDVFSFVDDEQATGGVFGMTNGRRYRLEDTGTTSKGWASTDGVMVIIGEQA